MSLPSNEPELLFTDQQDTDVDEDMVEEMYLSMVQRHPYWVLDQTQSTNIYGEPVDEPVYAIVDPPFPVHIKLSPEENVLNRYGFDGKRDAIIWFCSKIQRERGVHPKVGDRVDFIYLDSSGVTVHEQLILNQVADWDFKGQSGKQYQITATAERTQKAKVV